MKLLSLVFLSFVTLSAHAVYSPVECKISLSQHAATAGEFTRWAKIQSLEFVGNATLLMRAEGEDRPFKTPADPRIQGYPEVSFELNGDTYALVSGSIAAFKEQERMFAAANGGRRLYFRLLEPDHASSMTDSSNEVSRKNSGVATLARPLQLLDAYLKNLAPYRSVRSFVAARTERSRAPDLPVSPRLRQELDECLTPGCQVPIDPREDAIVRRFEAFVSQRAPKLSLRSGKGALADITLELLSQVSPDTYFSNVAQVEMKRLANFDFKSVNRQDRLDYLTHAYRMIEFRVWPDQPAQPFIMFNIERTLKRFAELADTPRARQVSIEHFLSNQMYQELTDSQHRALRRAFPLTIVSGDQGFRWVVASTDYARNLGQQRLTTLIERVTDSSLPPAVRVSLQTFFKISHETRNVVQTPDLGEKLLETVALDQNVITVKADEKSNIVVIPLRLTPRIEFPADSGAYNFRSSDFERDFLDVAPFGIGPKNGIRRVVFWDKINFILVEFTYRKPAGVRPVYEIQSVKKVNDRVDLQFFRDVAERFSLERLDHYFAEGDHLTIGDQTVRHLRIEDHDLARAMVGQRIFPKQIRRLVAELKNLEIDPINKCGQRWVDGQKFEVCLTNVFNGYARLLSVSRR